MSAMLHPLVTPSDYIKLESGTYVLPSSECYLELDGSICNDPQLGALHYNRCLIRYLKRQKNTDLGSLRFKHIFSRYASNHRIKKVREVATLLRAQQLAEETNNACPQSSVLNSFSAIESVLFFHVPVETLK